MVGLTWYAYRHRMDKVRKLFSLSDHCHASVGIYQPSLVQWGNSCKVEISLINLPSLQKLLERSYTTEASRYAIYPSLHGGRMWHKIGLMWGSYDGVKGKKMPSHRHHCHTGVVIHQPSFLCKEGCFAAWFEFLVLVEEIALIPTCDTPRR